MQARPCWNILSQQAEDRCAQIQQELSTLALRCEGLQANERRLRQLYGEYHARLTSLGLSSGGMQAAIGVRQFMQQIDTLLEQVQRDQLVTQQAADLCRQRLSQALRDKLKMQSLLTQDLQRQRSAQARQEQQRMDELAVGQYNLRQRHGHA